MKKYWWTVIPLIFIAGSALADYAATPGSGLNFASVTLAGPVHYMANMLCDMTVGKTQCAAVSASGQVSTSDTTTQGTLSSILTAVQSPIPAGSNVIGYISNDPCSQGTKLGASINLTAGGQVIAGTSAKKTYICSLNLISATAQNIALVEGTGSVCATNIFGLAGGTTAATGWNLAANGGLTVGSGSGTVISPSADTNAAAANVCLLLSGSGQTSGHITYVQL